MPYVETTDLAGTGPGQGAELVGFRQAGAGALAQTVRDKLQTLISAADFGLSSNATAAANLAALQAAVDAVPTGGTLVIPDDGGICDVATEGGLTEAVTIDRPMNVVLQGRLRMTFAAVQPNPTFIFNLTAPGVSITGGGSLFGDGTTNDVNAGTDAVLPGLIRIAADNCSISNLTIVTPPKVGVMVVDCSHVSITDCRFTGGPLLYSDTAYFGVRVSSGTALIITGNHFYPDEAGGMYVQCLFANGASDCVIANNIADRPYEKLVYWYGSRNTIANNKVAGNPGIIPGTNQRGTVGGVFRVHGRDNKVVENHTYGCAGGCSAMDGPGNEISRNQFLDCGNSGIAVFSGGLSFDRTTIKDNVITHRALEGVFIADGIYIAAPAGPSHQIAVDGNTLGGFSASDPTAALPVWQANTSYPKISVVVPSVANGRYYVPRGAGGVSGGTEPVWPTTPGATIVDGTITWEAAAYEGGVQAEIRLIGAGIGAEIRQSTVSRNNIVGGQRGISLRYVTDTTVAGNRIAVTSSGLLEAFGNRNRYERNFVEGGAHSGVQGIAATSILDTYRVGTWTPAQGGGLTVSGAFGSEGGYTVDGNWCHVWGRMTASVGIRADVPGELTSNLPVAAAQPATGTTYNTNLVSPSTTLVVPSVNATRLYTSIIKDPTFPNGVSTLLFSLSYQI